MVELKTNPECNFQQPISTVQQRHSVNTNPNEPIAPVATKDQRSRSPLKRVRRWIPNLLGTKFFGNSRSVDLLVHRPILRVQSPSMAERKNRGTSAPTSRPKLQTHYYFNTDPGWSRDKGVNCLGTTSSSKGTKKAKKSKNNTKMTSAEASNTMTNTVDQAADEEAGVKGVEFSLITDRIAALLFPTSGLDSVYRAQIKAISERLKRTYPDQYKIFNVSQKRSDLGRANAGAVLELGWPDHLAPPLDRLCSICKQIENFLGASPKNVAIVHCKGWRSRAAIVIAAYMHYTNICASDENVADRFAMQLFAEKYLEIDGQPSHKRYIKYFANLLSGATKVYPAPIFLTQIALSRLFAGKTVVLKIYERMKPAWSSGQIQLKDSSRVDVYSIVNASPAAVAATRGLSLRGDVLLKCFCVDLPQTDQEKPQSRADKNSRQLLFQCQFNTCALDLGSTVASSPTRLVFHKEQIDLVFADKSVHSAASLELAFMLEPPPPTAAYDSTAVSNPASNCAPRPRKSASPATSGRRQSGEFSRADSYENFDRAEDDRSLSLSLANADAPATSSNPPPSIAVDAAKTEEEAIHPEEEEHITPPPTLTATTVTNTPSDSQEPVVVANDGADSGIGSDSPKTTNAIANQNNPLSADPVQSQENGTIKKMPPQVPPKPRRSSLTNADLDSLDPDDPLRGAYEDSTIGRDHSVLPPGARPKGSKRRNSQLAIAAAAAAAAAAAHDPGSSSATSSGGESATPAAEKPQRILNAHIEPDLVVKGRYDPNSRCFSYVPVKSLKEHYSAPKKPPARRPSVVTPTDLDAVAHLDAAAMSKSLQNLHFPTSAAQDQLRRRPETPKWENEIDKVAGRIDSLPPRRRASTSGGPVIPAGHRQSDFVPAPRPEDDFFRRRTGPVIPAGHRQGDFSPAPRPEDDFFRRRFSPLPSTHQSREYGGREQQPFVPNGFLPQQSRQADAYETSIQRQRKPQTLGEGELPMVVDQAKRAQKMPARYGSRTALNSNSFDLPNTPTKKEMDDLCDPEFYMSYSPAPDHQQQRQKPPGSAVATTTKGVYRGIPGQLAANSDLSPEVRELLAQHDPRLQQQKPSSTVQKRRSRTPPHDMATTRPVGGEVMSKSSSAADDEYRRRNCRSVNSTPLWKERKQFATHDATEDDADSGADNWLRNKMQTLESKRFMDPEAQRRRNTERILLEELKNVAATRAQQSHQPQQQNGGGIRTQRAPQDPLEEYRREEERLKNTQSPFVDELRLANRKLQNRAPQPPPTRSYQQQSQQQVPYRSASVTPAGERYWTMANSPAPYSTPASQPPPTIRRGATPTGQILREKPPTPPPSRDMRHDRSRSPQHLQKQRLVSSSVPADAKRNHVPAVNPSLYALRHSLYQQERDRLGVAQPNTTGRETAPVYASDEDEGDSDERYNGPKRPGAPKGHKSYDAKSNTIGSPYQQHNQAHHRVVQNGMEPRNGSDGSPVKSILKRSNGGSSSNGSYDRTSSHNSHPQPYAPSPAVAAPRRNSATQQLRNATGREGNHQTPIEESYPPYSSLHRSTQNPNQNNYTNTSLNRNFGDRSDTPAFPVTTSGGAETPLPYHPLLYRDTPTEHLQHQQQRNNNTYPGGAHQQQQQGANRYNAGTPHSMYHGSASASGVSRRSSLTSIDGAEVIHHHPVFVKDTSKYWYKPTISREDAIAMLKTKPPGTFVVRDSNSFPGAFGLALKVAQPPAGVTPADGTELVRHFLIEPSNKGVRLKGCSNEPVFGTLAALVYQHSITPLALPCRLILPEYDPAATPEHINSNQALLERGAACNVAYLCSVDTESLTGPEALRRSIAFCLEMFQRRELRPIPVHFKVSAQGITLTDNTRTLFFRRHYPVNSVTFAGIDPESRTFDNNNVSHLPPTYVRQAPIFGFVARKFASGGVGGYVENCCHVFAELDPDQPASAVVRFVTNVMMPMARAQLQQIHKNQQ